MDKRSGNTYRDPDTGKIRAVEQPDFYRLDEDECGNVSNTPIFLLSDKED